jgi:hypothetical protein
MTRESSVSKKEGERRGTEGRKRSAVERSKRDEDLRLEAASRASKLRWHGIYLTSKHHQGIREGLPATRAALANDRTDLTSLPTLSR